MSARPEGPFWDTLRQQPSAMVRQRFEAGELFGFETRNKYRLEAGDGSPLGYAAEQGKGLLGFLGRSVLGHWREFDLIVFDPQRQPVLRAHHPFRFFMQRLEVSLPDGRAVGALQQRWSFFTKRFDVLDASGRLLLEVRSPIWKPWTFPFLRGGQEVAAVRKRWAGSLSELFTDKDRFQIALGPSLSDEERALLLAAAIFIDLQYFEAKAS